MGDEINPDLRYRLWVKKGKSGTLRLHKYGVVYLVSNTPYGEIWLLENRYGAVSDADTRNIMEAFLRDFTHKRAN